MEINPEDSYYTESITEATFPATNLPPSSTDKFSEIPAIDICFNEPVQSCNYVKEQSSLPFNQIQTHSKTSVNPISHTSQSTAISLEEISQMETPVSNFALHPTKMEKQASLVSYLLQLSI